MVLSIFVILFSFNACFTVGSALVLDFVQALTEDDISAFPTPTVYSVAFASVRMIIALLSSTITSFEVMFSANDSPPNWLYLNCSCTSNCNSIGAVFICTSIRWPGLTCSLVVLGLLSCRPSPSQKRSLSIQLTEKQFASTRICLTTVTEFEFYKYIGYNPLRLPKCTASFTQPLHSVHSAALLIALYTVQPKIRIFSFFATFSNKTL